ncbi:MAG: hypothetical protein WD607_06370 [Candidatus Paceibacterota bacterium]
MEKVMLPKIGAIVKLSHIKQSNLVNATIMRKILLLFVLLMAIISCNSLTPEEKEIKATLGKIVETGMFSFVQEGNSPIAYNEFRGRYRHISLVYLEDGCRPCFPRYIEWQTRMDTMDLNHDFTVLFIINGMSFDGFLANLLESNPEYDLSKDRFHVIIDSEQQFLNANHDIPRQILDKSLLIDKENRVRLIGHPFASPQIAELFYRICNEAKN